MSMAVLDQNLINRFFFSKAERTQIESNDVKCTNKRTIYYTLLGI